MHNGTSGDQVVVIVGAGLAGGNPAVTLREEGWKGGNVLLVAEPGVPYGRPPLSKTYLRGEEDLSGWRVKPAGWYGAHDIELRAVVTVARVDTAQRQVRLRSGETVAYQQLALCMGGRNRRFAVPGASLSGRINCARSRSVMQSARWPAPARGPSSSAWGSLALRSPCCCASEAAGQR